MGIPGHWSWMNFTTSEAAKRLNLKVERHEVREILTVNGSKRQSMPIFNLVTESLDGKASEKIQLTGTKLRDFTTVRRPDINKFKGAVGAYQRQEVLQTDWRRVSYTRDFRRQYLLSNKNRRSIQGTAGRANCGRNDLWLGNPWWKRLK